MLSPEHLKTLIRSALPDADVDLVDTRGSGDHFQARVVSPSFEGRTMVEQHRMVYAPLQRELGSGALHALALTTYTPAEWAKRKP